MSSREVVLLLADLSGYTAYLAASEPERAPALAADLVETVVRQLRPTFRLEKLEGDAAFMVAPADRLTGPALLDAIDATVAAFRTRLRSLAQSTTCDCEACRRIPELGLKFEGVTSARLEEGGISVLVVEGAIVNPTAHERPVPAVRVTLLDGGGRQVQEELFRAKEQHLEPGARTSFSGRVVSPADSARNFSVTFEVDS